MFASSVIRLTDVCTHTNHPLFYRYIIPDLVDWLSCSAPLTRDYQTIIDIVKRDNILVLEHIVHDMDSQCAGGDDINACLWNILSCMEFHEYLACASLWEL